MHTFLVFTFIADDRPGLVESLSNTVADHGGNWLDSRLAQLAGKFAGIVRISVPPAQLEALTTALRALQARGLTIVVEQTAVASDDDRPLRYALQVMGLDRTGIVKEISHALAARNINVLELETYISSAPMTGDPLFNAHALIAAPTTTNIDELCEQLDAIANELTVEIDLKPQQP